MRNTTLCTAMHEAGHAIAQLANPPAPWINSIATSGLADGLLGLVDTPALWQPYMANWEGSPEDLENWRALAWKDVINYLAGPIAELRWRRSSRAGIMLGADQFADHCLGDAAPEPHTDLGRVRARLRWAHPGDEQRGFIQGWFEAEAIVATHWRAIKLIGRLVHERGYIGGVELLKAWEDIRPHHRGVTRQSPSPSRGITR